jgi:hypothetical protein
MFVSKWQYLNYQWLTIRLAANLGGNEAVLFRCPVFAFFAFFCGYPSASGGDIPSHSQPSASDS